MRPYFCLKLVTSLIQMFFYILFGSKQAATKRKCLAGHILTGKKQAMTELKFVRPATAE